MKTKTPYRKRFKRGCIYFNTETNRAERVITITNKTLGTKAGAKALIEIRPRENFRSPSKMEIQEFVGGNAKFGKTALIITDAVNTALAYGDKVMVFANSDSRLSRIMSAVAAGNNRSLGQLLRKRTKRTKANLVRANLKKTNNQ